MWKYKIEEVERDFGVSGTFFIAFVRRRRFWGWREIGRAKTRREAELLCREYQKPKRGPWLYTVDSIMSDGGL